MDENSGHNVIASSRPPKRRPLERRMLVPMLWRKKCRVNIGKSWQLTATPPFVPIKHIISIESARDSQKEIQIWTSWANTRVKLHSQVHFGSNKILSPKKCRVQKCFNSINVLGPKKFWVRQNLGSDLTISKSTYPVITWFDLSKLDLTCLDLICLDPNWLQMSWPDMTSPDLT